ncbi:MAG: glycosyl hydrolase [Actinomycetota bacterium]
MRWRPPLSAALALLVMGTVLLVAPSAGAGGDPSPAMFGTIGRRPGITSIRGGVEQVENQLNRPMAAIRIYDYWDTKFPQSHHRWLRDSGHTIYLSVKSQFDGGPGVPWRQVADAPRGSAIHQNIVRWAVKLRDFGDPIHFTFNHEPETAHNTHRGTANDYKDAWRRVVDIFRKRGADENVTFTWILTDHAFRVPSTDRRFAQKWFPGPNYVEEMGADVYNWFECRPNEDHPWRSPEYVTDGFRLFGEQYPNIPMSLPEWGAVEDPDQPGRKAGYIAQMQAMLQRPEWDQITTALYFHRAGTAFPTCNWAFDSSESSRAALEAMGADPWYQRSESINYPG